MSPSAEIARQIADRAAEHVILTEARKKAWREYQQRHTNPRPFTVPGFDPANA